MNAPVFTEGRLYRYRDYTRSFVVIAEDIGKAAVIAADFLTGKGDPTTPTVAYSRMKPAAMVKPTDFILIPKPERVDV